MFPVIHVNKQTKQKIIESNLLAALLFHSVYQELHAELMSQMDTTSDKSNVLEAVLVRSEEERAALQVCVEVLNAMGDAPPTYLL